MRKVLGNGLEIRPIRAMVNHNTTEVFFDNMRVPASSLIGQEGRGFRSILDGMTADRILISHESLRACRWFIEKATKYACDRRVFGRPNAQNQAIHLPLPH